LMEVIRPSTIQEALDQNPSREYGTQSQAQLILNR